MMKTKIEIEVVLPHRKVDRAALADALEEELRGFGLAVYGIDISDEKTTFSITYKR